MKLVINTCYGGFGLSLKAWHLLKERCPKATAYAKKYPKDKEGVGFWEFKDELPRNDPGLVSVVEELGGEANGNFARLEIREIPDGSPWEIDTSDGWEVVVSQRAVYAK